MSNQFVREFGGSYDLFKNTIHNSPKNVNLGSSENVNCSNCINCVNCKKCYNCRDCINCSNCINCVNCVNCKNKKGAFNLILQ